MMLPHQFYISYFPKLNDILFLSEVGGVRIQLNWECLHLNMTEIPDRKYSLNRTTPQQPRCQQIIVKFTQLHSPQQPASFTFANKSITSPGLVCIW